METLKKFSIKKKQKMWASLRVCALWSATFLFLSCVKLSAYSAAPCRVGFLSLFRCCDSLFIRFWLGPMNHVDSFQISWWEPWIYPKKEKCQRHVISDIEREDSQTAAHEINRDDEPNATKDETIRSSRKSKYIYHINKGNAKKLKGGPLVSPSTLCFAEKQEKLFWLSSLGQTVKFDTIKFRKTFVDLFWSVRVDWKK